MAPWGPVPEMVGNETSFIAPVRSLRALDLGHILDRLEQADRVVAAHRLAAGDRYQPAQGVGGGRVVKRDRRAASCQFDQLRCQRARLGDVGGLFEMVADAVR